MLFMVGTDKPPAKPPQSGQKGKSAMAITNEQVLSAISEYRSENSRPCPANYLVAKFGEEVLDIISSLKKDGTLVGKRGRTGGLVPADTAGAAATVAADTDESVSDQFAALAAKLADSEQNEAAVG